MPIDLPPPLAVPEPSAATVARGRQVVLAALAGAGVLTLLIHFMVFPPQLQMLLRDWGLHWSAVLSTSLFVAVLLGADTGCGAPFAARLATWGPFLFLALHELGQWIWPVGKRDLFDSVRDLALNAVGAGIAAWLLRHGRAVSRARLAAQAVARAMRSARAAAKPLA